MEEKKKPDVNVEIQLDEEVAQGVYANLAVVNHSETEFVLDFVFMQPQAVRGKVRSRVITSPQHYKRLLLAMEENLRKYEQTFGAVPAGPVVPAPIGSYN
ncbi:MAG: DUF3467 domain-containing protein [Desulfuromonadales bacterium]|jgi:hypothetical protein